MSYSDYPHPAEPDLLPKAPESGVKIKERPENDDADNVVIGDGFGLNSTQGIFVLSRLRLLEQNYPGLALVRKHCEVLGLDLKPLFSTLGLENTVKNFCCQLHNFIRLVLFHFDEKLGATLLLSRNADLNQAAQQFVHGAALPGKAILDLLSLQVEVKALEGEVDRENAAASEQMSG